MNKHLSRTAKILSNAKTQNIIKELEEFLAADESCTEVLYSDNSDIDEDYDDMAEARRSITKMPKSQFKRRKLNFWDNDNIIASSKKHTNPTKIKTAVLTERDENIPQPLKQTLKKPILSFKDAYSSSESVHSLSCTLNQSPQPCEDTGIGTSITTSGTPIASYPCTPESIKCKQTKSAYLDNITERTSSILGDVAQVIPATSGELPQTTSTAPQGSSGQLANKVPTPIICTNQLQVTSTPPFSLEETCNQKSNHSIPALTVNQPEKCATNSPGFSASLPQAASFLCEGSSRQLDNDQTLTLTINQEEKSASSTPIISTRLLQAIPPVSPVGTRDQKGSNSMPAPKVNQAEKDASSAPGISTNLLQTTLAHEGSLSGQTGSPLLTPTLKQAAKVLESTNNISDSSILAASTPLSCSSSTSGLRQMGALSMDAHSDMFHLSGDWVKDQLSKSPDGRSVLKWFKDHGTLISRKRDIMVKIIIDNEVDEDASKYISSERFMAIADAICQHFICETPQTYYIPRQWTRLKKIVRAKGKLYNRWINLRRSFRNEKIIIGRLNLQLPSFSDSSENEDDLETESAELTWVKNKSRPLSDAITNFKATCSTRLREFKNSKKTILQFLHTYPAYLEQDGHLLIEKDFQYTYPGKENKLLQNWNRVADKIIKHAEYLCVHRKDFASQLKGFKIDLTIEDERVSQTNALLVLPLLFRSITVKKAWRLSKTEAKDAFLLFVETSDEAVSRLALRKQRLFEHNCPEQPTPVTVGYEDSNVCIGNVVYTTSSPLCAVDLCCKILFLLKVDLPGDSLLPLLFLKCFVYEIEVECALNYQCLETLRNDLQL